MWAWSPTPVGIPCESWFLISWGNRSSGADGLTLKKLAPSSMLGKILVFLLLIIISSLDTFLGYFSCFYEISELSCLFRFSEDTFPILASTPLYALPFCKTLEPESIFSIARADLPPNSDFRLELCDSCTDLVGWCCNRSPLWLESITDRLSRWLLSLVVIDSLLFCYIAPFYSSSFEWSRIFGDLEVTKSFSGDLQGDAFFSVLRIGLSRIVDRLGFKVVVRLFFMSIFLEVRGWLKSLLE